MELTSLTYNVGKNVRQWWEIICLPAAYKSILSSVRVLGKRKLKGHIDQLNNHIKSEDGKNWPTGYSRKYINPAGKQEIISKNITQTENYRVER